MIIRRYKIDENLNLTLSQKAIEHVLHGDFADKVFQTSNGRVAKKVITGGLHTYSGWLSFLSKNPKLKKVSYFHSDRDEEWFYERELQNGTILLKLPESALTSSAAKMTMHPENNYKSGYLWKTLFPKDMTQDEILVLLDEALSNISKLESRKGEIICYYKLEDPLKSLRISVLYRDGEINSFFPTWSQPNTGNNGKPFSFFDNIGHVISASTHIRNDEVLDLSSIGLFSELSSLTDLPSVTPSIFLERKTNFSNLEEWEESRKRVLEHYVEVCNIDLVAEIYNYINDEAIYKYHDLAIQTAYKEHYQDIIMSEKFYNSTCINQNLSEGILILFLFDQKHKTNLYSNSSLKIISNMFTSPLIDSWAKKRIHHILAELTLKYHDKNFPAKYLDCISTSPSRRELYSEYFYESHDKKFKYDKVKTQDELLDLFLPVSYSPQNMPVTYSNFVHYFSENLGESYSMHFTDERCVDFLFDFYPGEYYTNYINSVLKFISQNIFTRFHCYIDSYLEYFSGNDFEKPKNLHRIIHEYFKLQVAQRYRINLNYSEYSNTAPFVTLPVEKKNVYATILKHERQANRYITDEIIASVKEYLSTAEDVQLAKTLRDIEAKYKKETPRLPIPYDLIIKMVREPESLNVQDLEQMKIIEVERE